MVRMQALDHLRVSVRTALRAVGPRAVAALVLHEAVGHARRSGLDDAARVLRGARADLDAHELAAVAEHAHLGWPAIAAAFGVSERAARARFGRAVRSRRPPAPPG
jgi:hypothetical protein